MSLPTQTVLALRERCLVVQSQAMAVFDSLEHSELTQEGASAVVSMAANAEQIRLIMLRLASTQLEALR